jgi:hypothetical protein
MQTEGDRLKYYIESKEVSILSFCKQNSIIYTSLHPILQNDRPLGMLVLKKIMNAYPNLNVNWVLTGLGNIEITEEEKSVVHIDPGYKEFLNYFDKKATTDKINTLIVNKINEKG